MIGDYFAISSYEIFSDERSFRFFYLNGEVSQHYCKNEGGRCKMKDKDGSHEVVNETSLLPSHSNSPTDSRFMVEIFGADIGTPY